MNRIPLTIQILIAMVFGVLAGLWWGESVSSFGVLGKLIIQLIKAIAVPLVFFAIIEAILTTTIPWRSAGHLVFVTGVNAICATVIGLSLSNYFEPGKALSAVGSDISQKGAATLAPFADKKLEFSKILSGYVPESIVHPFQEGSVIGVIVLALLGGIAARRVRERGRREGRGFDIEGGVNFFLKLFEEILHWLVRLVPLAVFGATAKTVGEYGFAPLRGLAAYLLIGMGGLVLHCIVVYPVWIRVVKGIPLGTFFREARSCFVYAFGTNSSLATLPLTLKALDRLGISKASSRLGACVGTNLNNDGILLYEAMAVLFVAQAHGIDLSLGQQVLTAIFCVVAAMGVAGVPEAGIISLSLVLTTVGLPLDMLPLLLTVDWIIARARSVTNVMSDMTVSIALDGMQQARGSGSN